MRPFRSIAWRSGHPPGADQCCGLSRATGWPPQSEHHCWEPRSIQDQSPRGASLVNCINQADIAYTYIHMIVYVYIYICVCTWLGIKYLIIFMYIYIYTKLIIIITIMFIYMSHIFHCIWHISYIIFTEYKTRYMWHVRELHQGTSRGPEAGDGTRVQNLHAAGGKEQFSYVFIYIYIMGI